MDYLLKASAVIALFYLCYTLFLKRETFFESNRWFLIVGLIFSLIFPLINIPNYILIEATVISETNDIGFYMPEIAVTSAPPVQNFDWFMLLPLLYGIGVLFFSIQFLLQFGSLILLMLKNPKHKEGVYTYIIVKRNLSPFSFFRWIVYNPDLFTTKELELIINHEKVHVRQFHSIDILITRLICIVFWCNPFVWLYKKGVEQNLEYIADHNTQNTTASQKDYQHLLLKTSVSSHSINLTTNFYNSLIKKRIIMLNKSRSKSILQFKSLLVLPLLAILLMSVNTEDVYIEIPTEHSETLFTSETIDVENAETESIKRIEIIFTKNTSEAELDSIKKELKSLGIEMNVKKIKRNKDGIITKIDISFKGKHGTTNYNVKQTGGITSFQFKQDEDGFGVSTVNEDYSYKPKTTIINDTIWVKNFSQAYTSNNIRDTLRFKNSNFGFNSKTPPVKSAYQQSIVIANQLNPSSTNKVYIIPQSEYASPEDSLTYEAIVTVSTAVHPSTTRLHMYSQPKYHNSGKLTFKSAQDITNKDNSEKARYGYLGTDTLLTSNQVIGKPMIMGAKNKTTDKINTYLQAKDKPLFIVDNKIISASEFKKIDPERIKSFTIHKSEKAMELYGERAKFGAVIIKTRLSTKNPWAFSVGEPVPVNSSTKKTDTTKTYYNIKVNDVQFIPVDQSPISNNSPWDFKIISDTPQDASIDRTIAQRVPLETSTVDVSKLKHVTSNNKEEILNYISSGKKPLIIVENKIWGNIDISSGFDHSYIREIKLIEGKEAVEAFGAKAKDGAVIIVRKNNPNEEKWQMSKTELNSVSYIDDENPKNNSILYFVSKNSTDEMLENYKDGIKEHNINVKYSKLRRNSQGEIVQIKISLKDKNGNATSANFEDNKGIKTVRFGKSENGLVVNTKSI